MSPVWRDLGQGDEDEGTILHSRVGENHFGRRFLDLIFEIKRAPGIERGVVRDNRVTMTQQIKIQCA